jgi:predicted 2-oxoglutarate/Fe(II)-dependent dioxygenase YbiX
MCQQQSQFELQKYTVIKNAISKESCAVLTNELKSLAQQKKTVKDDQCPLSESIYADPVLDALLEQMLPVFEKESGLTLLPTYAYARLYAPGDELKIHIDRPACEISATVTLGFEGTPWPIYMGDQTGENASEIYLDVGDAAMYRGCEKHHWRNKFEGKWQAQVFLHYVDANGPYSEWKYDKRNKLSHHEEMGFEYWFFENALTAEDCTSIIAQVEGKTDGQEAKIDTGKNEIVNKEIRDVKRVSLPTFQGVGAMLAGAGLSANSQAWNFSVTHANQCDYLKYDIAGHYHSHVDTSINPHKQETRKLTILAFLNDDFEGGRFYLQIGHLKTYPPQQRGTVIVFPSFLLHGVEPVTKGIRRSIVTWLVGPWFK